MARWWRERGRRRDASDEPADAAGRVRGRADEPPPAVPSGRVVVRLSIELVPETSWGSNVRALVSSEAWDRIRRRAYRDAGYRCQVCGGRGPKHPVECHEQWAYDDHAHIQRLERMIALCPACHEVKHFGRANRTGRAPAAYQHLKTVNGWDDATTDAYLEHIMTQGLERAQHHWTLDPTALADYGVPPPTPPTPHAPPAPPQDQLTFELSGDEPERGQLITHPAFGPLICDRIVRRQPSSCGPPILTIAAHPWPDPVSPPDDQDYDEDAGAWHDPDYVEALIDQADRQRAFDRSS